MVSHFQNILNVIYSSVSQAEFSAVIITPDFSVAWSFRHYSNMLICCLLIISVENIALPISAA